MIWLGVTQFWGYLDKSWYCDIIEKQRENETGIPVFVWRYWYMNFEELTIRGNEFGVNSINHEDDKGYDELGNWDN